MNWVKSWIKGPTEIIEVMSINQKWLTRAIRNQQSQAHTETVAAILTSRDGNTVYIGPTDS
jgi:hypothetical protein